MSHRITPPPPDVFMDDITPSRWTFRCHHCNRISRGWVSKYHAEIQYLEHIRHRHGT